MALFRGRNLKVSGNIYVSNTPSMVAWSLAIEVYLYEMRTVRRIMKLPLLTRYDRWRTAGFQSCCLCLIQTPMALLLRRNLKVSGNIYANNTPNMVAWSLDAEVSLYELHTVRGINETLVPDQI